MSVDDNGVEHGSPRDYLRRAAMELDATGIVKRDAFDVTGKALGARWTLLDEFEVDGKQYVLAATSARAEPVRPRRLTSREKEVLALAATGLTNKEIAYELGVAATTIRVLIARAAIRLGVLGRQEAIAAWRATAANADVSSDTLDRRDGIVQHSPQP